ncbi:hypothetical protein EYF80_033207 [Liparis tanakae]|uniref:Uncharacterized protein n=1 Tax=Liparis tanakae TaxID=230148 RepID=A0A4Z2GUZ6_9TELE|nr:hypothetical protein EYF80_033207 [Liparis tanakae]
MLCEKTSSEVILTTVVTSGVVSVLFIPAEDISGINLLSCKVSPEAIFTNVVTMKDFLFLVAGEDISGTIENLQRASASGLTADQLIDLPEAAGIHQAHLRRRKEAQERE